MKNLFIDKLQTLVLCGMLFYNQVIISTAFSLIIVLYKLLIMGDYHFPALIYLIWIRTKNSPLLRGCMFPLHHKAYQQLIYITMELPTTGQYEVISLWQAGQDLHLHTLRPIFLRDSCLLIPAPAHMVERSISPFIARFSPFPCYLSSNELNYERILL